MTEAMNDEQRAEVITKASNLFGIAGERHFDPESAMAAGLGIGLAIANELHAISVALELANQHTMEGRRRP